MATMEQRRGWQGPAVLSYGFRPFFFGAGIVAALMIALWVPWFLGLISVPSALPPIQWHIHELLFGYVPAVVAGFLLTAVPNWTGRLPVVGWPLAALAGIWLAGRAAIMLSALLPFWLVGVVALAFPVALAAVIARELVAGRNWRNLKVLIAISIIGLADAAFLTEIARDEMPEIPTRLAIGATLMLILIIGGRIVPSFTRNWIKHVNPGREPAEFGRFDKIAMVSGGVALLGWSLVPMPERFGLMLAAVLAATGLIHIWRLKRWVPERTFREPLVTILHVAYGFVPLGFLMAAAAAATGDARWHQAATHAWTTGAIGLMTLAVMTRASRGHSGRALTAPLSTVLVYLAVGAASILRITAALVPEVAPTALSASAVLWVGGYVGFAVAYYAILILPPTYLKR
jgi:uncharacterized protein involved in response to NO